MSVESDIGPRLTSYIQHLIRTPASVSRTSQTALWAHSTTELNADHFAMASAVAFKADSAERTSSVKERAAADLLMSFTFTSDGSNCAVRLISTTPLGAEIATIMATIPLDEAGIQIVVD